MQGYFQIPAIGYTAPPIKVTRTFNRVFAPNSFILLKVKGSRHVRVTFNWRPLIGRTHQSGALPVEALLSPSIQLDEINMGFDRLAEVTAIRQLVEFNN